ncbi:MAG: anhydro-N-acetylmuramic acid kinase [Woeseiaceae bacterium]|nr:anhydro-N-acetylmuramic acid kinase [Woeseiaceae bacterium]
MADDYYIGLMSGTSMDGVDAVLAAFGEQTVTLAGTCKRDYPDELRQRLRQTVTEPQRATADELGTLDAWVGQCFSAAARTLMSRAGVDKTDVRAIGSHGQTVLHQPHGEHPFTLQIGNPAVIAATTGIDTVADFRRSDMALGGQGAPLVPIFHDWLFRETGTTRGVLNIGGIANVTVLPQGTDDVSGFDTGPGNTLLDAWIGQHDGSPYDDGGRWAATGSVDDALLARLLADPYFALPPPKSTGTDYFNLAWLERYLPDGLAAPDVQATLVELTAASVADAVDRWAPATSQIFACGGGVHNAQLIERLRARLQARPVDTTAALGLDPDWVEATAFAWLAMRRVHGETGNLPSVTGASRATVLGAVYLA